jgi:RNA 3'-terminal phosphate cyclase (ATP)
MKAQSREDVVELDGRTGEGGGQLVRIAVGLSALTGTPIRIHHVRGNRGGGRGGGRPTVSINSVFPTVVVVI